MGDYNYQDSYYGEDYSSSGGDEGAETVSYSDVYSNIATKVANTSTSISNIASHSYNNRQVVSEDEDWSCCNDQQTNFLLLYFAFWLLAAVCWKAPMAMLAEPLHGVNSIIHETCHAIMCWLTGGEIRPVDEVDLTEDGGGVARYQRGSRCLIIPAGFIGSGIWAMALVMLSGSRETSTVMAGTMICLLAYNLAHDASKRTNELIGTTMTHIVIIGVSIYLEWDIYTPLLQYLILFYGVTSLTFILCEIQKDAVPAAGKTHASDAYACYEETSHCCLPRCVAFHWTFWIISFQLLAVWVAMAQMSDECKETGWMRCIVSSRHAVDAWDGIDLGGFWLQAKQTVKNWQSGGDDSYE